MVSGKLPGVSVAHDTIFVLLEHERLAVRAAHIFLGHDLADVLVDGLPEGFRNTFQMFLLTRGASLALSLTLFGLLGRHFQRLVSLLRQGSDRRLCFCLSVGLAHLVSQPLLPHHLLEVLRLGLHLAPILSHLGPVLELLLVGALLPLSVTRDRVG